MGNVHMEATQINYRGGSKKMSVEEAIKAAGTEITPEEKTWIDSIPALTTSNAGKTDQAVIAPEFDSEAGVYAIGDLVMHEGKLYEFTTAHETAGDWDSTEVTEKTVEDEIDSVKSGLTNVTRNNFGSGVDVTSYNTESNKYTFPDDGYLVGFIGSDEIKVKILGATTSTPVEALLNTGVMISVRKGMRFYVISNTAGKLVAYVPFA